MKKRGILLLNLGGPERLEDVKPFLFRLFSDPAILVGVPYGLRQLLAFAIAQAKGRDSIENYRSIGGGSPQLAWTRAQAKLLEEALRELSPSSEWKVTVGMRAAAPFIEQGLEELCAWGAVDVVLLPLFPQYSTTTTGSCFDESRRVLTRLRRQWAWQPRVVEVEAWSDHAGYIELLRETVEEALSRTTATGPVHVLFSAHSLPLKIIERGDPYVSHVARTVRAASQSLLHSWSLAYQSRNGKLPWLEPYTEDEIPRLAKAGVRELVVVPISFVSDHIETLHELDQLYAGLAREHGIAGYYRARAFNGEPRFGQVLADIVQRGGISN